MTSQRLCLILRIGAVVGLPGSLYLAVTDFAGHRYPGSAFNCFVTLMFLAMFAVRLTPPQK